MNIDEIRKKNKEFNKLRKNRMEENFIIHRDGSDIELKEWIFNTINNRKEFHPDFILTIDLCEYIVIELQKAFVNGVNSIVDYHYYIKVLLQNHIKNDVDEFKRFIVMSWYNMSYLFPTAQLIYNTIKLPLNDIKRILNELTTYLEFKKKQNRNISEWLQLNILIMYGKLT
jgi:hypothetical protein